MGRQPSITLRTQDIVTEPPISLVAVTESNLHPHELLFQTHTVVSTHLRWLEMFEATLDRNTYLYILSEYLGAGVLSML
ncbi:unnamed protein product [Mesocestoides corti]|uniref:Protein kinase domain-containing protein n=1 Tax=Mesocestoides corti TaxID=53468 RepID=A0A0R3UQA0_MESCO|nr:unnamed protein product [Mesocestoides corti]